MVNSMIDVMIQIGIFKQFKDEIFQPNGKAKPCSDAIYKTLTEQLKGMSKKAIQTSINRNVNIIMVCRK